ncbi:MAG TPA: MauE/DoxX family redox-associated membrane protein, partial [Tepidisphaeraceae bacterium]|nr:MauE/DoxX family redox-associated membrane protein [Tepidisphaeraceae bacterium]
PPPPRARAFFGYDFVSRAFAVILLIAAGLKLQRLVVGQAALPLTRSSEEWVAIALEWGMAAWLLWGVGKMWARRAAMLLLAVFLCVAAWRWHAGDTDCGCFGAVAVHPAWTTALDAAMLLALWALRPLRFASERMTYSGALSCAVAATCIFGASFFIAGEARADIHGGPRVVVLHPSAWRGQAFPLLPSIDPAARADLSAGRCTVILFDRNCEKCRRYLIQRVIATDRAGRAERVQAIDIAPASDSGSPDVFLCAIPQIKLRGDVTYAANVPVEISLDGGLVDHVSYIR